MMLPVHGHQGRRRGDPHPVVVAGWSTAEAFVDHLTQRKSALALVPVDIDFDSAPIGVLGLQDLLAGRAGEHRTTGGAARHA